MLDDFRKIFYSCKEIEQSKTDKDNNEGVLITKKFYLDYSRVIPRVGVIFVADLNNETSLNDIVLIIKKLNEVEKSTDSHYQTIKAVFINKLDKLGEGKKIKNIKNKFDGVRLDCEIFYVSALTNEKIHSAMSAYLAKLSEIYTYNKNVETTVDIGRHADTSEDPGCMSRSIFCGGNIFGCSKDRRDYD